MIRFATADDADCIALMRRKLWPSASLEKHKFEFLQSLKTEKFKSWIALDQEQPLAFAEITLRDYANGCKGSPVIFLEGIWVDEGHRKSGVGAQLIAAIEAWAKKNNFDEIGSDSEIHNLDAHEAHQRWGFAETERVVYFRKQL